MARLRTILSLIFRREQHAAELESVEASFLVQTGATSLDAVAHGAQVRVLAVEGAGAVVRRLMEMGVVPGAPVRVVRAAPLGDPLQVCVRDYHLALRRTEARAVRVAPREG